MKLRNDLRLTTVLGTGVFLICVLILPLFQDNYSVILTILIFGSLISVVIILSPTLRKMSAKMNISPVDGFTVEWDAVSRQPIRTILPKHPTNSTRNLEALRLTNEGRELVSKKTSNHRVDLTPALEKFQEAARLDETYWEPRINIAQILLLTGKLKDAYAESEAIRVAFRHVPLAYAKAGLIAARVIEQTVFKEDSETKRQNRFAQIIGILEDNLAHCPGHLTTMTSLGRAKLLAGANVDEMREFLDNAHQYPEFAKEFKKALISDNLLQNFNSQFPGHYEDE